MRTLGQVICGAMALAGFWYIGEAYSYNLAGAILLIAIAEVWGHKLDDQHEDDEL